MIAESNMKKIISKKQRERKERKNQMVLGIILVLLMVLSLGGYALMSGSNNDKTKNQIIKYNQIEFIENSGNWYFNLYGSKFETRYNPKELENMSLTIFNNFNNLNSSNPKGSDFNITLLNYQNKPLYFSGDSENFINCFYEINKNINPFILRQQLACLENETCSKDLPIKNCKQDNIIIIKNFENYNPKTNLNFTEIYQRDNCVFIITNDENLMKSCDLFLFKILGIY